MEPAAMAAGDRGVFDDRDRRIGAPDDEVGQVAGLVQLGRIGIGDLGGTMVVAGMRAEARRR